MAGVAKDGGVMGDKLIGFAAMTPEEHRAICARGGVNAQKTGRTYRFTSETAKEAGRKGGVAAAQIPGRLSEIGRKGGVSCAKDIESMRERGRRGAMVTNAKKRAAREAGGQS